ncbi:MAG: HD-GYP domain-containing protein [Desulfotomaculum sp.]|nr:HD-GYP domain-containing protein [Desulfotomaculum sp.]
MRRISIDYLKPGMRLARSICSSGQVLLKEGVILTEKYISKLKQINVPAVYIYDELISELEVEDVIADETRLKAISNMKKFFKKDTANNSVKNIIVPNELFNSINEIMDDLLSNRNIMVNLSDIRSVDDYVFGHSVNVCVLALITGIAMGYDRRRLYNLAVGAMLHDIGKIKVPKNILDKPGKLTKEEFEVIKKHSLWGYEILKANVNINITSTVAVYQHHERYNGQGYPQGLKGKQIHEFAQIVGLVDMYDAITANRVYRKAYPPHEAFEMIAGSGDYLFRYDIVKAFLNHVAAYPAGTVVQLNSGETGVVLETEKGMSLRPKIKVLFDPDGVPVTRPLYMNLVELKDRFIVRVLEDYQIERLNFCKR